MYFLTVLADSSLNKKHRKTQVQKWILSLFSLKIKKKIKNIDKKIKKMKKINIKINIFNKNATKVLTNDKQMNIIKV